MSPPNSSERKRLWANGLRSWLRNWFCRSHDVSNVKLKVGEAETSEVTAAVMAHILSRPDSIRQRAQNAATISGALAVALVVASVTGLTDESESFDAVTQGLVFGAIVVFVLSTLLSVHAVAFPHSYKPKDGTKEDDYQELVRQYEEYADEVRQKMRWAAAATGLALVLTAVAVVVETAEKTVDKPESKVLVLSPEGFSAMKTLCAGDREMAPKIYGSLREDELAKDIVEVESIVWLEDVMPDGSTGGRERRERRCEGTVNLPRESIRAAKDTNDQQRTGP